MIKVSILIPSYNQENFIEEAILSAIGQTYENIEVVVCDDASLDSTWSKINNIKCSKLRKYRNSKNLGRVANYRKLLYELSSGDYVINLDGDDYFLDMNYIKKAVALIEKNNLDLVFSNQIIGFKNSPKSTRMNLPQILDGNWLFLNFGTKGVHIPHSTAIYKRSKAIKMNFYRKDISSSDWESLLRYIINSKIGFIKKPSVYWRQIRSSESKNKSLSEYLDNIDFLLDSVLPYAENFFDKVILNKWRQRFVYSRLISIPQSSLGKNLEMFITYSCRNLDSSYCLRLLSNLKLWAKILLGKLNINVRNNRFY